MSGLSFCNFKEVVSWCKVKREALKVRVFSDAAITLRLVLQSLNASGKGCKIWKLHNSRPFLNPQTT